VNPCLRAAARSVGASLRRTNSSTRQRYVLARPVFYERGKALRTIQGWCANPQPLRWGKVRHGREVQAPTTRPRSHQLFIIEPLLRIEVAPLWSGDDPRCQGRFCALRHSKPSSDWRGSAPDMRTRGYIESAAPALETTLFRAGSPRTKQ
jgi:hypothetical protein